MTRVLSPGAARNADSEDEGIGAAVNLLKRAIAFLDADGAPPDLAARVQEALDAISAYQDRQH